MPDPSCPAWCPGSSMRLKSPPGPDYDPPSFWQNAFSLSPAWRLWPFSLSRLFLPSFPSHPLSLPYPGTNIVPRSTPTTLPLSGGPHRPRPCSWLRSYHAGKMQSNPLSQAGSKTVTMAWGRCGNRLIHTMFIFHSKTFYTINIFSSSLPYIL